MHHRRLRILRVAAGRACTVLAAQGQVDVVPARIVLAHRHTCGVEQHLALGIGDVDAVVDLVLRQAPDIGLGLALAVGTQQYRQAALAKGAGLDVVVEDFRKQVGGVDQGFFGGLAHTRANLLAHGAEDEIAGQPDEQEIHQENPYSQAHQLWLGL
ncbi:hypothetical protein D9M71_306710 [compost metagenome]